MYKILEAVVGSVSYGLATPESDIDKLGIWLEPTRNLLEAGQPKFKDTYEQHNPDLVYHELGKWIKMLLVGNPHSIELLFADKYEVRSTPANLILDNKYKFLSAPAIAKQYIGYAETQLRKYRSHTGRFNNEKAARKNAKHTFRLLVHAYQLLDTGQLSVMLSSDARMMCQVVEDDAIKRPQAFEDFITRNLERVRVVEHSSALPEKPDMKAINEIMAQIRYDYFWSVPDG